MGLRYDLVQNVSSQCFNNIFYQAKYQANGFSDSESTFVWEAKNYDCEDKIHQIWKGEGIKYKHRGGKEVLIVKDEKRDIYAGINF